MVSVTTQASVRRRNLAPGVAKRHHPLQAQYRKGVPYLHREVAPLHRICSMYATLRASEPRPNRVGNPSPCSKLHCRAQFSLLFCSAHSTVAAFAGNTVREGHGHLARTSVGLFGCTASVVPPGPAGNSGRRQGQYQDPSGGRRSQPAAATRHTASSRRHTNVLRSTPGAALTEPFHFLVSSASTRCEADTEVTKRLEASPSRRVRRQEG